MASNRRRMSRSRAMTGASGLGAFALAGAMMMTAQPRAAAPASMAAQLSLSHNGSGTMITLPGGARLYSMARATDDSFAPKPASVWTARAPATPNCLAGGEVG